MSRHYYHDLTRPQLRDVLPALPEQCALSDSIRVALDGRKLGWSQERTEAAMLRAGFGIEVQEHAS